MSPGGMLNKLDKKKSIIGRAEETKVNFFNPAEDMEEEEGELDHQIIETKIDPLEWNKEIDRVYRDLVKIEQEVEILKKQGGDQTNDFEECRRHLELIIEMCNDIK